MFRAELFTIDTVWNQPKCPSTNERIKKMWYTYTMEYSSSVRKNEIMPFTATRMDLGSVIVTEVSVQFSSVAQACPTLRPHGLQHARPPCPSPTPGVYPNSCPLSRWCHPTISSSVVSFSSCPQPFLTSGSFQMSEVSQRQISYDITYTSYLKKWYKWTYLQNRNRLTERIDLWLSKGKWSRRDNLGILDYQIHTIMYQIQRLTV